MYSCVRDEIGNNLQKISRKVNTWPRQPVTQAKTTKIQMALDTRAFFFAANSSKWWALAEAVLPLLESAFGVVIRAIESFSWNDSNSHKFILNSNWNFFKLIMLSNSIIFEKSNMNEKTKYYWVSVDIHETSWLHGHNALTLAVASVVLKLSCGGGNPTGDTRYILHE